MQVSRQPIYRALFVQGRGGLRDSPARLAVGGLRRGRPLRRVSAARLAPKVRLIGLTGPVRRRRPGAAVVPWRSFSLSRRAGIRSRPRRLPRVPQTNVRNRADAKITFVCTTGNTGTTFGLCAVNGDGGGRVLLVTGPAAVNGGELSPDGSRLTYFAGPNAGVRLWLANADGSNPVNRWCRPAARGPAVRETEVPRRLRRSATAPADSAEPQ
jgi:hypothetical protein